MVDTIAIVYATKGGATRDYALAIAGTFRKRGHLVDVIDLRRHSAPDLSLYRNIVLGTGVRTGRVYGRAKRFLKHASLAGKRLGIFLASGVAVDDPETSKEKYLDPLVENLELRPVMCDAFPGQLPGHDQPETIDIARAQAWAETLARRLEGRARRAA